MAKLLGFENVNFKGISKNNLFNRKMGNFAAQFNCISFLKISIFFW